MWTFHPRRQRAEDFVKDLLILLFERGDFGRHVDRLRRIDGAQLVDALLEFEQPLLAIDDRIHDARLRRVFEQAHERALSAVPVDHHVDRAFLQQELGRLKLIGKLLPDRLLDHAPSGKADHRLRFGDDHVGLKRERRRDAAGRRIGQHGDRTRCRLRMNCATAAVVFAICISASMPSSMRAPPDAVNRMHGSAAFARFLEQQRDAFADDRTHRAAAKVESP